MTRINVGINPRYLTDTHLLAEHREIKRVNALVKALYMRSITHYLESPHGPIPVFNFKIEIPSEFTLGKGHVTFFYDKWDYLTERYGVLYQECIKRGFNVTNYSRLFMECKRYYIPPKKPWLPRPVDRHLIISRVAERIMLGRMSTYKWYGINISKEEALTVLYLSNT
jgi:deoxyribonuclease (pyrimidine dimer)